MTPKFICRSCGVRSNGAIIRPRRSIVGTILANVFNIPRDHRGCPVCGREDLVRDGTGAAFVISHAFAAGRVPKTQATKFDVIRELGGFE